MCTFDIQDMSDSSTDDDDDDMNSSKGQLVTVEMIHGWSEQLKNVSVTILYTLTMATIWSCTTICVHVSF